MIIIGLEDCQYCKDLLKRHPECRYIELPKKSMGVKGEYLDVKRLMGKNKLHLFPVVCNDEINSVYSLDYFDPIFKTIHPELY